MYTIIMNSDKSLTTSVRTTLYQHENLADQIQFIFPQKCGLVDLTECTAILKYIDQGNISHSETLAKDSELYKDKLRFILPVDSKLNYFAGNVVVRIIFAKINSETGISDQIVRTGECVVTIDPSEIIEDMVQTFEKINVLEKQIEKLQKNQVDDLKLTDDLLQLSVDGEVIGEGVMVSGVGNSGNIDEEGIPVVDFDSLSEDTITTESENSNNNDVIEF